MNGMDGTRYTTKQALLDAYWFQGIVGSCSREEVAAQVAAQVAAEVPLPLPHVGFADVPLPQAKYVEVPSEEEAQQHDAPSKEDGLECRICMDNAPICVILPCMHQCICCSCARRLALGKERGQVECSICKTPVKKIKRVFV